MRDNGVNAAFLEPSAVVPVLPMVVIGISIRDASQAGSHSTRKNQVGATGPSNLWLLSSSFAYRFFLVMRTHDSAERGGGDSIEAAGEMASSTLRV